MRILIIADGGLHGDRFLGDLQHLANLVLGHFHAHGELFGRRLAPHFLQHLPGNAVQLVDGLDHVHRNADGARLIGNGTGDRLPNPPRRIGRELIAASIFELVDGLHQADVAFLNQVKELQPSIRVFLGDRNHQAQVGFDHLFLRAPRLRFADGNLAIDFLDLIDENVEQAFQILELVLAPLDLVLEFGKRSRIALLRLDVLVEPARAGFVLGKRRDEILARHAGLLDAKEHDFLFKQPHFGDMLAQIVDQLIEHLGRELQLHQFAADLLADLQCLRILRSKLVECIQELMMHLRNRAEALCGFFRVRPGIDDLFVLVAFGFIVVVGGFFALQRHHLRILRLRDFVRCIRIDEADDDIDEAHLPGLDGFEMPQQQVVRARVAAERNLHGFEALFDALGDANFAFASQQFDRAHFAHIHAHGIGGAAEFSVQVGERRRRLLNRLFIGSRGGVGQQQRFGIRCFFVHRNTHVVNHVDDIFDLLRIDDFAR